MKLKKNTIQKTGKKNAKMKLKDTFNLLSADSILLMTDISDGEIFANVPYTKGHMSYSLQGLVKGGSPLIDFVELRKYSSKKH